jgi:hypothetical protein
MPIYMSVFLFVGRFVYLRLSICLRPSMCIYLCGLSVSVELRLSICLRPSIYFYLCGLSVSETYGYLSVSDLSASICIYLCGLAAKLFCATSYFPGAAPSTSPVKQPTDTKQSVMSVRWFAGPFRASAGDRITVMDRFALLASYLGSI